jgi:hypothetical protein
MTEQQHVPVEDLAAYAARDLDATAAVAVEAHLVLCADCRADVDAVTRATAALAAVEPVAMPPEVAASVDAALAAESRRAPAGDVLPMRRRRRPSFAGIAAVAAGVALVGAVAVPLVRSGGTGGAPARTNALQERQTAADTRRLASGLDYTHTTVADTLGQALGGRAADDTTAFSSGKSRATHDTAAGAGDGAEGGAGGSEMAPGAPAPLNLTVPGRLADVQADPARLAACIAELATGQPPEARVPVVVDFARYEGKPAIVVALPTIRRGAVTTETLDVFIAGPGCGTVAGGDVLDFVRIPRPAI